MYESCTFDLANVVLQSIKANAYLQGKHRGGNPSLLDLASCANPSPTQVVCTLNKATANTPMYKAKTPIYGDKKSARHKRKFLVVIEVEDDTSHCPEYNFHVRDRKQPRRPRKTLETSEEAHNMASCTQDTIVVEIEITEFFWAI